MAQQGRGGVAIAQQKRKEEEQAALAGNPAGAGPPEPGMAQPALAGASGGGAEVPASPQGGGAGRADAPDMMKDRGTPDQKIEALAAGEAEAMLEQSAARVNNEELMNNPGGGGGSAQAALAAATDNPAATVQIDDPDIAKANLVEKKMKVNENMEAIGSSPEKALAQLRDQRLAKYKKMREEGAIDAPTYTKLKDRWKNIFTIIPREDMGLVLMDFGLRAMMAGENMGTMAALGAAGSGALQGVMSRREADYDRQISQEQMADEGARADLDSISRAKLADKDSAPDTITTDQGMYQWDSEQSKYVPIKGEDGETVRGTQSEVRPPVDKWKIEQWQKAFPDMSRQEAVKRVMSGVTPEQARLAAESDFNTAIARGSIFIPGKGRVSARNVTDEDREAFINNSVSGYGYDKPALRGGGGGGGGGALPDPDARIMTKPPNMSASDWNEYNKMMDEAEALESGN